MSSLTNEEKEDIARLQFDPLPPERAVTYQRYLVKGPSFGVGMFDDFSANEYEKLVHGNPDVDIDLQDLKSIVEEFKVDNFGRRLGDPSNGPYDSITEKVVDSYMHCICTYKNKAIESKAEKGGSEKRLGESQRPDIEIGGTQTGKVARRINEDPRASKEGKGRTRRNRSRSPESGQRRTGQTGSSSYRSRTPVGGERRSFRTEPPKGLSSSRSPERRLRNEGQIPKPERTTGESTRQQIGETQATTSTADYRSCVTLYCEGWAEVCHGLDPLSSPQPGAFIRKLEDIDCLGDSLRNLDYLFLPTNSEGTHYFLVGIAPKQKFVFAIDSYARNEKGHALDNENVDPIVEILLREFPGEDFPMYGQWALRSKTTDGSPNCAQQSDIYNCGVFTITNALCLAFGYELLCYTPDDLDEGKRPRVAAELLHGGFVAPFNYPLLDIPFAQVPTVTDRYGERFVEPESIHEDTEMRDGHIVAAGRNTVTPIIKHGEWPAQFDPRLFKKAGLMYAIKEPMFEELKYKYELVAACRKHKIKRYTRWKKRPAEIFRGWMENIMAGRKAESSGGLKPFSSEKKIQQRRKKTSSRGPTSEKPISKKSVIRKPSPKARVKETKAKKDATWKSARVKSDRKH